MTKKQIIVQDKIFNSISEACKYYNLPYETISTRLRLGWSVKRAFSTKINTKKSGRRQITLHGKTYKSVSEACKYYNLSYTAILNRLNRGWSVEKAFEVDIKPPKQLINKVITLNGEQITIGEACKKYNIKLRDVNNRWYRNWSIEEIFEFIYRNNNCSEIVIQGNTFKSIKEACDYHNVNYGTICARMSRGMSAEEAITTPVMDKNNGNGRSKPITVDGKRFVSIKAAADYYGLNYGTVKWKLRKGWSIEDTFNISNRKEENKNGKNK